MLAAEGAASHMDFLLTREAFAKVMQNSYVGLSTSLRAILTVLRCGPIGVVNRTALARFLQYLSAEGTDEKLRFYLSTLRIRSLLNHIVVLSEDLLNTYIGNESICPVNLPERLKREVDQQTRDVLTVAGDHNFCVSATEHVLNELYEVYYPRFVKHQLLLYTRCQLSSDTEFLFSTSRHRLKGLGDCFVITDPTIHDNTIIMASVGFVELTGYKREEINANCRFLQGPRTSIPAIQRIRESLRAKKPHTELLINYRANGEPFWNLLHIIPLNDVNNETKYFFGAQIDVSDIINSHSSLTLISEGYEDKNEVEGEIFEQKNSVIRKILSALKPTSRSPTLFANIIGTDNVTKTTSTQNSNNNSALTSVKPSSRSRNVMKKSNDVGAENDILNQATSLVSVSDLFVTTYSRLVFFEVNSKGNDIDQYFIRFMSPEFCRATGYDLKLLSQPLTTILAKKVSLITNQAIRRAVNRNEPLSLDTVCLNHANEPYDTKIHLTPMRSTINREGTVLLWVMVFVWPLNQRMKVPEKVAETARKFQEDRAINLLEQPLDT